MIMFDWVGSLDFLRGNAAALLLVATAVFVFVVPDVRLALAGLAGQYFFLMVLYLDVLDPRLALLKLLVGWFVCLILLITGQQMNWGRVPGHIILGKGTGIERAKSVRLGGRLVSVTAVRGVLALVMLGIVWLLARQDFSFSLPESLAYLNLAVYGLVGFGLLGVFTSLDEPLRAGIGVLMLTAGLELYYHGVFDQSSGGMMMVAVLNLGIALIVAYLTQKRSLSVGVG